MLIDGLMLNVFVSLTGFVFDHSDIKDFSFIFLYFGVIYGSVILYNTFLLTHWNGATIGKKIMGIKVITTSGEQLDWVKAFLREISKILSGAAFFLGYLWMLWDENSQTWHDKIAETLVVEAENTPEPPVSSNKTQLIT